MRRIAVCVYTTNAAGVIRAVEIASAISRLHHDEVVITFFTYRGNLPGGKNRTVDYEHLIQEFDVNYFGGNDIVLDDAMWQAFRQAELNRDGIFPPPYDVCATKYLRAVIDTLTEYQPDILVYGLFPEVALAAAIQGWKSVSFSAIERNSYMNWISRNSDTLAKIGVQPNNGSKHKNPWRVIQNAAIECGLKLKDPQDFMNAICPSRTALCDFESFYDKEKLEPGVTIVGPLISSVTHSSSPTTQHIEAFLESKDINTRDTSHIKVLFSMGSTGKASVFVECLKALNNATSGEFRSVVLVPCWLHESNLVDDTLSIAKNNKDILIVKDFVPVRPILSLVDVLICHGGQQSIQCGLAAGIPILGVPTQVEQCFNLQNVESCNAGLCILPIDWEEKRIRDALHRVGSTPSYKREALKLQQEFFRDTAGAEKVASLVWDTL